MKFASTLDLLGGEIFASLNEKKLKLEKEGRQIYNMSVGTPDFVPPAHIVEALRASAADPASWSFCRLSAIIMTDGFRPGSRRI